MGTLFFDCLVHVLCFWLYGTMFLTVVEHCFCHGITMILSVFPLYRYHLYVSDCNFTSFLTIGVLRHYGCWLQGQWRLCVCHGKEWWCHQRGGTQTLHGSHWRGNVMVIRGRLPLGTPQLCGYLIIKTNLLFYLFDMYDMHSVFSILWNHLYLFGLIFMGCQILSISFEKYIYCTKSADLSHVHHKDWWLL